MRWSGQRAWGLLLTLGILISCERTGHPFMGLWELFQRDELRGIVRVTQDSLFMFQVSISDCDTSIERTAGLDMLITQVTDSQLTAQVHFGERKEELILRTNGPESLKFCVYDRGALECKSMTRSVRGIERYLHRSEDERLMRSVKWEINDHIKTAEEEFWLLLEHHDLSAEAGALIEYIDSVRAQVLALHGVIYEDVKDWRCVDSLLAHSTVSAFLMGSDPNRLSEGPYSGFALKNRMIAYLSSRPNQAAVDVLFPRSPADNEREAGTGVKMPWEVKMFYHLPLGKVVEALNVLKRRVVQVDRLASH